jgi:hypothetical protein
MLVSAILAKNEADRFLSRVIRRCQEFSDKVLLLDDGSSDETTDVATSLGCEVRVRKNAGMWGNESPARAELWNWAAEYVGDGWALVTDADQLLVGDPRPYCESWLANTWSFPLFDCWNQEDLHRVDGYWQGYRYPRPWLFCPSRVPDGWTAEWTGRGIHAGHAPVNWPMNQGFANELYWLHLGWMKPEDRTMKYQRYMQEWHQLSDFEQKHVQSVLEDK